MQIAQAGGNPLHADEELTRDCAKTKKSSNGDAPNQEPLKNSLEYFSDGGG